MIDLRCELTEQEMGEIALKIVRHRALHDGMRLKPASIHRNIGRMAKELDVPPAKVRAFANAMVSMVLEAALNPSPRDRKTS